MQLERYECVELINSIMSFQTLHFLFVVSILTFPLSTLFGVCVLQIKPQLEKLLNLPNDALTKEIALTQVVSPLSPFLINLCVRCQ